MANEYIDLVDEQLRNSKTIAVVGLSNNPDRDSHRVASYMQSQGYRIIPVNPVIEEALGRKATLTSSPFPNPSTWSTSSAAPTRSCPWSTRPSKWAPGTSGCRTA